ncbi:hypothetical protein WR25_14642 isoform A [Diploscapter pachys]|uniref:Tetratricopeptide repeat protein 39B n=1 Tax=Diploscapter pachys TaxID=2018661 RepID=A0A2A2LJK0_9BILA|nr:hypothetical protein WR25_14642 isoform A [Diploscapter pachys]
MNNKFELSEERMAVLADRSMYHALGYSTILFIKAMMTCNKTDMEVAMEMCKRACTVIESKRQKLSLSESIFNMRQKLMSDEELHAELCYAEVLLIRAVLSFFHDESLTSFVRGAFRIRTCYQTYKYCEKVLNDDTVWKGRNPMVRRQFESGVRMGNGMFNLGLSTLPSKVLRLLAVVGFSGDKTTGMVDLHTCASMTDTLCSPLAMMTLLAWHLIACFLFGSGQPDLRVCHQMMPALMHKYPNGAIILFLRARLVLIMSQVDSAICFFNKSVNSQNVYLQFHHICYWELLFAHAYNRDWTKSANYARLLYKESKWSRCVYIYLMCIFFAADTSVEENKRKETIAALARKVDACRMRIAGKSIPIEKFCARRAKRFLSTGSLLFAHYEFIYFWNGFDIIGQNANLIEPILKDIEHVWKTEGNKHIDDEALYLLLKGVCLQKLHKYVEAEDCFQKLIQIPTQFTYLPPNATFELAQIRIAYGMREEAEALLAKARQFSGYPMENKLHFRIHSAMENLGARTPMAPMPNMLSLTHSKSMPF